MLQIKYFFIFVLTSGFINISFSQETDGNFFLPPKKTVNRQLGLKFEIGGLLHQKLNQNFINAKLAYAGGISLSYKLLYIKNEVYTIEFSPNKEMHFDKIVIDNTAKFISLNLNSSLGYMYYFNSIWSSSFWIGINMTDFDIVNSEEINEIYSSNFLIGGIVGTSIDRYIELKDNKCLALSLGIAYYSTNYNSISRDLKRSSLNYSLSVAYIFWFKKV